MAEYSICSNCGNKLKEQWLVCKHCHQARWRRIIPYYIGGVSFLSILLVSLPRWDNGVFLCTGSIFGLLGVIMLLIGGIATLQGLTVRKNIPAIQPTSPSNPTEQELPEAKLKKLQEMLSAGLITQEDYEKKKAEILSRM